MSEWSELVLDAATQAANVNRSGLIAIIPSCHNIQCEWHQKYMYIVCIYIYLSIFVIMRPIYERKW